MAGDTSPRLHLNVTLHREHYRLSHLFHFRFLVITSCIAIGSLKVPITLFTHGKDTMLEKTEKIIGRIVDAVGILLAITLLLMVLNVAFDVMMRYLFRASSVGMQEMEWHLFAIVILFGVGVALKNEGHVRVDFLYDHMRPKTKALINIFGTLLFLMPLSLLIFFGSIEFVHDAYAMNEISEDPGGLPYRWIIKGMIPLAFAFLLFSATGYILQNITTFRRG